MQQATTWCMEGSSACGPLQHQAELQRHADRPSGPGQDTCGSYDALCLPTPAESVMRLYVVGSRDETVELRGMRYHSIDIETSVIRSHKSIAECVVFTWTNLLVVVLELSGSEQEALDLVPLVTNVVLEDHYLIVWVVVVDPGVIPGRQRDEQPTTKQRYGQPTAKQRDGQPTAKQRDGQPTAKQRDGQPTAKQRDGQPTAKQRDGQPTAKQRDGQPTAKQRDGQPTAKQRDGQHTAKQRDGQPTAKQRDRQPTAKQRDGQPTRSRKKRKG
ncbi:unnamed protein product [Coregonus sp. 'balchen']|nr:unnamed protein product [Coregonus sp. 'balchen']